MLMLAAFLVLKVRKVNALFSKLRRPFTHQIKAVCIGLALLHEEA
jgi:hypothetical protein